MGILTRRQGSEYVIGSDCSAADAPSSRAPKGRPASSYEVWTGEIWSAVITDAKTFATLDAADEYVRANFARVIGPPAQESGREAATPAASRSARGAGRGARRVYGFRGCDRAGGSIVDSRRGRALITAAWFGDRQRFRGDFPEFAPSAVATWYDEAVLKSISQKHLDALCPELRQVFDAEIAAGNHAVETRTDWPNDGLLFVLLCDPFHGNTVAADSVLFYTETTPRTWKGHYCHLESKQILACGFGEGCSRADDLKAKSYARPRSSGLSTSIAAA